MHICILIDNKPTDVLTINVNKVLPADKTDYINDRVLAFTKAEICNVASYQKQNKHEFVVKSTSGHNYNISWKKVTIWTEKELTDLL